MKNLTIFKTGAETYIYKYSYIYIYIYVKYKKYIYIKGIAEHTVVREKNRT